MNGVDSVAKGVAPPKVGVTFLVSLLSCLALAVALVGFEWRSAWMEVREAPSGPCCNQLERDAAQIGLVLAAGFAVAFVCLLVPVTRRFATIGLLLLSSNLLCATLLWSVMKGGLNIWDITFVLLEVGATVLVWTPSSRRFCLAPRARLTFQHLS